MKFIVWKIYALYDYFCRYRLERAVPGILETIKSYQQKTKSTGTKYPTLYQAVKTIKELKPKYILESGTGTSTIVLAETILHIQKTNPAYKCHVVSMESLQEWHTMATQLLPKKYQGVVDIRLGEREKYEFSIFRGYVHSNIPNKPYDFVFLDGPSYSDPLGSSTCMDALKIRLESDKQMISCVVDTRVSSVYMMQKIFGKAIVKYFPFFRTCSFDMPKLLKNPKLDSSKFKYNCFGKIDIKNSYLN